MLRLFFPFLLLVTSFSEVLSGTLVIEGKYQNKNLYIQNSYSESGVGFCTYEVTINGQVSTDEMDSKTIEIDFASLPIAVGSKVVVEIKHKNDCTPKILNPEVLKPKSTFEMVDIKINKKGLLSWTTINEQEKLPFVIEQFRWNKWIKVGEIIGNGNNGNGTATNEYRFQTVAHSGENKFRIKQTGFSGSEKKSPNVSFTSKVEPPSVKTDEATSDIQFSSETLFEIYDLYGNVVKYGFSNSLNTANLPKGSYFLCYDNIVTEYIK